MIQFYYIYFQIQKEVYHGKTKNIGSENIRKQGRPGLRIHIRRYGTGHHSPHLFNRVDKKIPFSFIIKAFTQLMKILAIEKDVAGTTPENFQPYLKAEAQKVWELQQQNIIREIYFQADRSCAVLILECDSVDEAEKILKTLPLVQANLIEFEIIPLKPYPGFERLFDKKIND